MNIDNSEKLLNSDERNTQLLILLDHIRDAYKSSENVKMNCFITYLIKLAMHETIRELGYSNSKDFITNSVSNENFRPRELNS